MASKETGTPPSAPRRTTRKEFLLTRQEQDQYRILRLVLFGVVGFLVLVLALGLVFEYGVRPRQPVAVVNEENITLAEWQRRVRLERGQTIAAIDNLYELLGGDVNQLIQFAGQQMQALLAPAVLGESVLYQMIDEVNIRQEAARRGITVSDEEVQTTIEEQFNYYGGGLPPATPTGTGTPVPTPSITPITALAAADATPTPTAEPTAEPTPLPTATPVSPEGFNQLFSEALAEFQKAGGTEAEYRTLVRANLLRERVRDALAAEANLATEEENFSLFYISYATAEEAGAALAAIREGATDYLTTWNTVRSTERITATQPFAAELQWTSLNSISSSLGTAVGDLLPTLALDTPSDVTPGNNDRFLLIQLRGREMLPIPEAQLNNARERVLSDWLEEVRKDALIPSDSRWRDNTPSRPILDTKYFIAPPATATPVIGVTISAPEQ